MKDKLKSNIYFNWGFTFFCAVASCILLFFFFLRIDQILGIIAKIITVLSPIILGILFAYLLNPLESLIEKRLIKLLKKTKKNIKKENKIARILSITITYLIMVTILFLFVKFVLPSLIDSLSLMLTNIPIYINNIYEYLSGFLKDNPELAASLEKINADITSSFAKVMVPSMDTIMLNLTNGISNIISGVVSTLIAIIVSVYLLYDKETFLKSSQKAMYALLPRKIYDTTMTTLEYIDKIFGGFMIAKIIDSVIIGILTFIIISIFKIPYALIISVIVGITNIIPYFGPFIGAIPCAFLLLMIDPTKCLTFTILIFLIQQFDGNILGPKLIGNKTGIKSFWVLFSILLFGGLFGFVGMIFGVPVFAVIYSLVSAAIDKKLDKKHSK